jgi:hypothetical protein
MALHIDRQNSERTLTKNYWNLAAVGAGFRRYIERYIEQTKIRRASDDGFLRDTRRWRTEQT